MNADYPNPPTDAYPRAVYAADRHITPDSISIEAAGDTLILWLAGIMVGVSRDADDTRLQAALHLASHLSTTAEQYGAMVRGELEQRARARAAEPIDAVMRTANARPAPAAPAPGDVHGQQAPPSRFCTGCGAPLGPATPEQTAASGPGDPATDTRRDCASCRIEYLAEQAQTRAPSPPPAMPETGQMRAAVDPGQDGGRLG